MGDFESSAQDPQAWWGKPYPGEVLGVPALGSASANTIWQIQCWVAQWRRPVGLLGHAQGHGAKRDAAGQMTQSHWATFLGPERWVPDTFLSITQEPAKTKALVLLSPWVTESEDALCRSPALPNLQQLTNASALLLHFGGGNNLSMMTLQGRNHPHVIDGGTEALRGKMTHPSSRCY